mmetsp:Transcript_11099/g.26707  ORF Transcript_11099/g.26707 Transcript_11099/m.26707 type:complete len:159 (-) Transcript_11099:208-684(-)
MAPKEWLKNRAFGLCITYGSHSIGTFAVSAAAMAPKEMIRKIGEDGFDVEDFKAQLYKEGCKKLHIVDVYTAWCGPCLSIVPTFKNLQLNVDYFVDRCTITQAERTVLPEFEERFPETSKPRFLFYKGGAEVMTIEGLKAPEILKFIEENLPAIETDE